MSPLFLFQLPATLPLKGGLSSEASNVMSGAEYLAALAGSGSGGGGGGSVVKADGGAANGDGDKEMVDAPTELAQLGVGQLGELILYESGRVALQIGEHQLDVTPGTVCSCDQEIVAMGTTSAPGAPVDIHRLGKMHERLVVTPNVDNLLCSGRP